MCCVNHNEGYLTHLREPMSACYNEIVRDTDPFVDHQGCVE